MRHACENRGVSGYTIETHCIVEQKHRSPSDYSRNYRETGYPRARVSTPDDDHKKGPHVHADSRPLAGLIFKLLSPSLEYASDYVGSKLS